MEFARWPVAVACAVQDETRRKRSAGTGRCKCEQLTRSQASGVGPWLAYHQLLLPCSCRRAHASWKAWVEHELSWQRQRLGAFLSDLKFTIMMHHILLKYWFHSLSLIRHDLIRYGFSNYIRCNGTINLFGEELHSYYLLCA
jgi:hypothetical protein